MKKKVGLISKVSLMVALLFTAIGFSFIGNNKKVEPSKTQAYTWEEGYGMKDNSNIILSVTKVAVNANGATEKIDDNSKMAHSNPNDYYYRDIPNLEKDYHKTLVSDGSFIKLNNTKIDENDYKSIDNYYNFVKVDIEESDFDATLHYRITTINGQAEMIPATEFIENETYYIEQKVDESIPLEEAILITFGQEEASDGLLYYPINNLNVEILHNKKITVPAARSEGYKRDFGFIIGQGENNEGYYKITVKKEYFNQSGIQATEDLVFEFYIINDTTYTSKFVSNGNEYNAEPRLKLADGTEIEQTTTGVHVYNQGSTSKQFPALTYDYTLYKMSYTHTLDGATATYDYTYLPKTKQMQIVKTYKNQDPQTLETIDLNGEGYSNILLLLFSELGDYEFSFEYIYSGYPYPTQDKQYLVIDNINEVLPKIKLEINGFEANFSKKDYFGGAEMRYFVFNNNDKVYTKVVDGYEKGNAPSGVESLGIIYSYVKNSSMRNGVVVDGQDVNILSQTNIASESYNTLYTDILNNNLGEDETSALNDVLSNIVYESTDQKPVKLKSNVDFVKCYTDNGKITFNSEYDEQGSFYIFNANDKITQSNVFVSESVKVIDDTQYDMVETSYEKDFKKYFVNENGAYIKASTLGEYDSTKTYYIADKNYVARYTSDTSFNNAGYYLVFLAVKNDQNAFSHYQIIAFNNLLPDVSMNTEENVVNGIQNPTYTKEKIKLSWEEPDTFEMDLIVRYYYKEYADTFTHIYSDDELLATTPIYVRAGDIVKNGNTNSCIIGSEIQENESGRYLVIISNENGNEWTTSFTIDKQDITGIAGYGVFENEGSFSLNDSPIQGFITNSVQDVFGTTLSWNDKPSGAKVTAKYQTISFVGIENASAEIEEGKIPTNYKTNNAIDGEYAITKPINNKVIEDNVLYAQGIYLFSLVDEAGNEAKYLLILDNTQTYFKVTETDKKTDVSTTVFKTAEWLQYNDVKLNIKAPKYKTIPLDETTKSNIFEYINYINNEGLNQLFQSNYIQIKQNKVAEYDLQEGNGPKHTIEPIKEIGTDMPLYIMNRTDNTINVYDYDGPEKDTGTSIIRTYYIVGENQKYLNHLGEITASNSYIKVEINPDNSKGYVFYGKNQLTEYPENEETEQALRLSTYSNLKDSHMTNDNFAMFSWIMMDEDGDYEVGKVELDYYPLNLSIFDEKDEEDRGFLNKDYEGYYFFDDANKINKVIYSKNDNIQLVDSQIKTDVYGNKRGLVALNVENGTTQPGYYVITRTYAEGVDLEEGSNDTMVMKYHFIIDRNGIISTVDKIDVGQYIHIGLLENETEFNTFSQYTSISAKEFVIENKKIYYNPSLETNKLPAVMNIPLGKYNNTKDNTTQGFYSNYYAGQLEFTMYFVDYYNQLGKNTIGNGKETKNAYTLFSAKGGTNNVSSTMLNGDKVYFYSIDIKQYIQNLKNGTNAWNIEGLRDYFLNNGTDNDWLTLPGHYVIVINDRAEGSSEPNSKTIAFEIKPAQEPETPVYVTPNDEYSTNRIGNVNITSSQQYIKVEFPEYSTDNTNAQIYSVEYDGVTYIAEEGKQTSIFTKQGNKWTLKINTMPNEKDLYQGGGKDYKFIVKYKLSKDSNTNIYQNCYYAYDSEGNIQGYYKNTYTVTIDRTAPQENVSALIAADNIASYYGGQSLFEQAYYDNTKTKTTTYFVNRYTKYYANEKSIENIFPFVVYKSTNFISDDVDEVRYKTFDIENGILSLPAVNLNGYNVASKYEKYGDFLTNGYYEILEIDAAGNITQYVVLYLPSEDYQDFKVTFEATTIDGTKTLDLTIKNEDEWKTLIGGKISESILSFNEESSSTSMPKDRMFVMVITKNKTVVSTTLTNLNDTDLNETLMRTMKEYGHGNYKVYIHTRTQRDSIGITINYVEKVPEFEINKIVEKKNTGTYLNLSAANMIDNDIRYYISNVKYRKISSDKFIEYTYSDNQYKDSDGNNIQGDMVKILEAGEYILLTEDMFGRKKIYTFSTEYAATEEIVGTYDKIGDIYYSFDKITIKHAEGLYNREIKYTLDGVTTTISSSVEQTTYGISGPKLFDGRTIENGYRYLNLYPYIATDSNIDGKLVNITVRLYTDEIEAGLNQEIIYSICFDTRTGVVRLINTRNGLVQDIDVYSNSEKAEWINNSMTSGIMNLTWLDNPSNNFTLKYVLHEKINDTENGWLEPVDLSQDEDKIYVIKTSQDNKGLYAFEVQVWSKDGLKYLGNKTYVFMIKSDTANPYTVQSNTKEYDPNSKLTYEDIVSYGIDLEDLKEKLQITDLPSQMPLYISNEELKVVEDSGQGFSQLSYEQLFDSYSLTIYRVHTTSYSQYLATLQVPESTNLINIETLFVNGEEISNNPIFPGTGNVIALTFDQNLPVGFELQVAKKNLIRLEIYFNDDPMADHYATSEKVYYEIKGSGLYTFKIYDLAGNCHIFESNKDSFSLFTLANNEVAILTNNNKAMIENGYFSEPVQFTIDNGDMYDEIKVSAVREGKTYNYGKNKHTYTFTTAGTYRVEILAKYGDKTLKKTLIFTIINPEVATKSLNLNILENYKLLDVNESDEMTNIFKDILEDSKKGSLITYNDLKNAIGAGIFNGKQYFTLTYRVNDGIYPERIQTFKFSLSNADPVIKCDLKPGETDDEKFTITYNAGLIYEEIGEATIFVLKKGKVVKEISIKNNPEIKIENIVIKQKKYGSGEYNIRLVGGNIEDENILYSQNVELKAPLNTSSIIIIVVVSAVVIAGVVTFILLRRKMRIR